MCLSVTQVYERFQVLTAANMKFRVVWDVPPCSNAEVDRRFRRAYCLHHQGALMMEAVRTSETSANFNVTTWRYIPDDSKLHDKCSCKIGNETKVPSSIKTKLNRSSKSACRAVSKVRTYLRRNLCSQPYGSKSLVRSAGSVV
jgi:hypothetical protein